MSFKFGSSSKKIVGIDIGSSSIKIVKIAKSGHNFALEGYDKIDIPAGIFNDGIVNDQASISSYIRTAFERLGFKDKNVAVSIPCQHVIIKTIEMPKMKESELDSAIFFEAKQHITYDMNEVYFDYVILNNEASSNGLKNLSSVDANNNLIMIVAGKKDIVDNRTQLMHECRLNPAIVDVDCIAIENMFNFNYPEEDQMIALIKVGASETNVHIIENGFNLFRRDIPIGGVNITEEIQKKFQIDFSEAENIKIGDIKDRDANFKTNYMIYLNMIIARITSEIQRTIDYFAANNDKQYPKKIFLTGGSSKLSGLSEDIETKLNIPVTIVNPFRHITFKSDIGSPAILDSEAPMFCIAVGLALRGLNGI